MEPGYETNIREIVVRFRTKENHAFLWPLSPPSLLFNRYRGLFPEWKATKKRSWLRTFNYLPCYVWEELFRHFHSRLHGVQRDIYTLCVYVNIREGADKSLARPTSGCRGTESIVSLERGVCSCAELRVFSCYRGWKEACQATRAISTTSRRELSSSFFFFLQGKESKEIHAILTETLGEYAPSYATVKNWVAQFKHGDFSTSDAPRPGRSQNSDHPGDYWSNSRANLGRLPDFD